MPKITTINNYQKSLPTLISQNYAKNRYQIIPEYYAKKSLPKINPKNYAQTFYQK